MSHYRKNISTGEPELVFDGWENGVSESPVLGIADMRNFNNDSQPGVALCNYKLIPMTQSTPITNQAFTASTVNSTISWFGTATTAPVPVIFTGASLPSPLVAGTTYYLNQLGNTSTIYSDYTYSTQVTLTTAGSGTMTFSTINMGIPKDWTYDSTADVYYVIDSNGRVWYRGSSYFYLLNGNTLTNASGNGIAIYNDWLFVFRDSVIDLFGPLGYNPSWVSAWKTIYSSVGTIHKARWSRWDDTLYFTNNNYIGSIRPTSYQLIYALIYQANVGATSGTLGTNFAQASGTYRTRFLTGEIRYVNYTNGSNAITWSQGLNYAALVGSTLNILFSPFINLTFNPSALTLLSSEIAISIEEPSIDVSSGNIMYIGTSTSNYIYPWDKVSVQYDAPLPLPEIGTYQMLNINRLIYILAGKRGNIYYTEGSTIHFLKTMPKYPAKTPYPLFTWGGIMCLNNNLCFGIADQNNNASGTWAIQLLTNESNGQTIPGAIRGKGTPSTGNYNALILIPQSDGLVYYVGSYNGTNGVIDSLDIQPSQVYSNYESYIETDIANIGTALQPKTFNTIEIKFDTPLAQVEKVRVSMRSNLNATYVEQFEVISTDSTTFIDASSPVNIQEMKWVQIKIEAQTITNNNRTFCRIKEVVIR